MKVTFGTVITNRLRETGKSPADIARELGVKPPYVYRIIHGHDKSWFPSAMRVREAIAKQINTTPENLWPRRPGDENKRSRPKLYSDHNNNNI